MAHPGWCGVPSCGRDGSTTEPRAAHPTLNTPMSPFNTPAIAPDGYSLPPHWTPLLVRALRHEGGKSFYEVGTLPAAQAFGAPPRIDVNIEHDTARGALVVRALRLDKRLVPLHECGADWIGLWLES